MKIYSLNIENVKRVQAVQLKPAPDGLTVIGGGNGQGKTSVLDAIAWALGGDKHRPTSAQREQSVLPPSIRLTLDNGIIVERKGKNSALTVHDPNGVRGGQKLLDEFVSELAIDLPKFLDATDKEKAKILLEILGVSGELQRLDAQEHEMYDQRRIIGREADRKSAFVESMPYYPDAPDDLIDTAGMIDAANAAIITNSKNAALRSARDRLLAERYALGTQIAEMQKRYDECVSSLMEAEKACEAAEDTPTDDMQRAIREAEDINRMVRANLDREKAEEDCKQSVREYNNLTAQIDRIRKERMALLEGEKLPLEGLSIEDGCLTYKGRKWDCMSGSEQLKVGTAIAAAMKPACEFVLLDKLEQMDLKTLEDFGVWLEEHGLQAIATRVSTGDECTIIIEDGMVAAPEHKAWKGAGSFKGFAGKE